MNRRSFNLTAMASVAGLTAAGSANAAKPALKKALKYGMIGGGGSVEARFRRALACGFLGVELDSPAEIDRAEVVKAVAVPALRERFEKNGIPLVASNSLDEYNAFIRRHVEDFAKLAKSAGITAN